MPWDYPYSNVPFYQSVQYYVIQTQHAMILDMITLEMMKRAEKDYHLKIVDVHVKKM